MGLSGEEARCFHCSESLLRRGIHELADLDEKIAAQCIALSEQREQIQSRTGFHWWPKRIAPN